MSLEWDACSESAWGAMRLPWLRAQWTGHIHGLLVGDDLDPALDLRMISARSCRVWQAGARQACWRCRVWSERLSRGSRLRRVEVELRLVLRAGWRAGWLAERSRWAEDSSSLVLGSAVNQTSSSARADTTAAGFDLGEGGGPRPVGFKMIGRRCTQEKEEPLHCTPASASPQASTSLCAVALLKRQRWGNAVDPESQASLVLSTMCRV